VFARRSWHRNAFRIKVEGDNRGTINGMARKMDVPHGRRGYRRGCRCGVCRADETQRKREYRAGIPPEQRAVVRLLPTTRQPAASKPKPEPEAAVMGENEVAVRLQCANSLKAADQPGTVSQAITLAKILDREAFSAMHPTTSRQLQALLTSLAGPKRKSRGRLARVQSLTSGKVAQ